MKMCYITLVAKIIIIMNTKRKSFLFKKVTELCDKNNLRNSLTVNSLQCVTSVTVLLFTNKLVFPN